jgi:hypothetical protein
MRVALLLLLIVRAASAACAPGDEPWTLTIGSRAVACCARHGVFARPIVAARDTARDRLRTSDFSSLRGADRRRCVPRHRLAPGARVEHCGAPPLGLTAARLTLWRSFMRDYRHRRM